VLSANPLYWQDVVAAVARLSRVDFEPAMLGLAEQEIPEIVPLSASEASTAGQLILVAEDNVINQQVIQRQINALGLACELANDGVQALDRYRKGGIALLLTDCDMPNMDGYELSRQIRQSEEGTGHRLPIIAITANAMQGAREACAEAGMDDYLVKPLEIPALQEMLGLHLKAKSASPTEAFAFADLEDVPTSALLQPETGNEETPSERLEIEAPAAASVLDLDEMRDLFGDDEMLQTILDEFVEVSRETVDLILQGVEWGDAEAVGRQAHKLKSSARTVGAHQLADICLVLEKAGKSDDMAVITEQAPALEPSFAAVIQAIEGMK
jgi:two-component system sensor histidine kinase/response regulator